MTEEQKEKITKWIAALRSGEYIQGVGQLKKVEDGAEKYCCLGVACDVALKEGWIKAKWERELFVSEGHRNTAHLIPPVAELYGIRDDCPIPSKITTAIEMNDSGDMTFSMIADAIEEEYL